MIRRYPGNGLGEDILRVEDIGSGGGLSRVYAVGADPVTVTVVLDPLVLKQTSAMAQGPAAAAEYKRLRA